MKRGMAAGSSTPSLSWTLGGRKKEKKEKEQLVHMLPQRQHINSEFDKILKNYFSVKSFHVFWLFSSYDEYIVVFLTQFLHLGVFLPPCLQFAPTPTSPCSSIPSSRFLLPEDAPSFLAAFSISRL